MAESAAAQMTLIITSWFFLTGGIWKLFERVERATSDEAKAITSDWLQGLGFEDLRRWPDSFCQAFDAAFGRRHFTFDCFLRSSVASFVAVAILTSLWGVLRTGEFLYLTRVDDPYLRIFLVSLITLFLNLVPDYISLS